MAPWWAPETEEAQPPVEPGLEIDPDAFTKAQLIDAQHKLERAEQEKHGHHLAVDLVNNEQYLAERSIKDPKQRRV
jgi:hypothetical protein